jgi:hypothetical protein
LLDFNETFLFRKSFERNSNIKFHQKPSSERPVVPSGVRKDGRTDMTKLTVAFRHFANASKIIRLVASMGIYVNQDGRYSDILSSYPDRFMKRYWIREIQRNSTFTSVINKRQSSDSRTGRFALWGMPEKATELKNVWFPQSV